MYDHVRPRLLAPEQDARCELDAISRELERRSCWKDPLALDPVAFACFEMVFEYYRLGLDPVDTMKNLRHRVNSVVNTAMRQEFNTTELLEHILLQLPQMDLFVIERVCREWRKCVRHSPQLHIKKFPIGDDAPHCIVVRDIEMILEGFPDCHCPHQMNHLGRAADTYHFNPIVLNSQLFKLAEGVQTCLFKTVFAPAQAVYAVPRLNLARLHAQSSCLDLPISFGPEIYKDLRIAGRYRATDPSSGIELIIGSPPSERGYTLGDIWSVVKSENLDLSHPITIAIWNAAWVTQDLIDSVKEHGVYLTSAIARKNKIDALMLVAKHLSLHEFLSLRLLCRSLNEPVRERVRNHHTMIEYSQLKVKEMWFVAVAERYNGLIARCKARNAAEVTPNIAKLLRLKYGTLHYHRASVPVVFNEIIFRRSSDESIMLQALNRYSILELKETSESIKPGQPHADMMLTTPKVPRFEIEVLDLDGNASWFVQDFITIQRDITGLLIRQVKDLRGTGRLRMPNVLAITKKEWEEAQSIPVLNSYSFVLAQQRARLLEAM